MASDAEYYPEYSAAESMYHDVKDLFLKMQDLSFAARAMVFYSNGQLAKHSEAIENVRRKANKLKEFVDQTMELLIDSQIEMDDKEAQIRAAFEPKKPQGKTHGKPATKEKERIIGQATVKYDRTTRPAKSREDTTRKPFSLASAIPSNRTGT